MRLAIIGTGYVGLVTGTCLAESGNHVICMDTDLRKVEMLRAGQVPIYEPGLEPLFHRNIREGRLRFTTDLKEATDFADLIFLALPTPPGADGSADLSYVKGVAKQLSKLIKKYTVVVTKSTVPVGTADSVKALMAEELDTQLFDVASNPEFLREGVAVDDFMKPDRIVVGYDSPKVKAAMEELYQPFVRQGNPIYYMDFRSAEMTKYAANAYLATRISFMNEVANLCERTGADVDMVRLGIGSDTRIGKRFLFAGAGFGGSCFPKDVKALHYTAQQEGYPFRILDAVLQVNDYQRNLLGEKVIGYFGEDLQGRVLTLWGLAFKPNTDDIREAPSLVIIEALLRAGATLRVHDPAALEHVRALYGERLLYFDDSYQALEGADALVIVTEWNAYRTPDFEEMRKRMKRQVIFDGRNLYDLPRMADSGFYYNSIGRKTILP